jgi:hypothetical protein
MKGGGAVTPLEIESAVLELEDVRIVIRADSSAKLGDYKYQRQAAATMTVSEWLEQRVRPLLQDHGVVVIDGNNAIPHGKTLMGTIRKTYER